MLAPVVIFAYKRVDKLKECIFSLQKCRLVEKTDVIIYADGSRDNRDIEKVNEVRLFLDELEENNCFNTLHIVRRTANYGLAKSVIAGVTEVLQDNEKIIVVEDDLILAKNFLEYMNGALDYYKDDNRYGEVSAFTYDLKQLKHYKKDIYVIRKGDCWGWGTWKRAWNNVDWELKDFDTYLSNKTVRREFSNLEYGLETQLILQQRGELDAWAARWLYYLFINNYYIVYPKESLVVNIGGDNSGEHCSAAIIGTKKMLNLGKEKYKFEKLPINKSIEKEISKLGRPKGIRAFWRDIISSISLFA